MSDKFDDNVEVPPARMATRGHSLYQMPAGKSRFYPATYAHDKFDPAVDLPVAMKRLRSQLASIITKLRKSDNRVFVCRQRQEGGLHGVRVWRTQ